MLPNYEDVMTFLRVDEKRAYSISMCPTGLVNFSNNSLVEDLFNDRAV